MGNFRSFLADYIQNDIISAVSDGCITGIKLYKESNSAVISVLFENYVGFAFLCKIESLVAEKLQPFNVNIIATDPAISPDDPDVIKNNKNKKENNYGQQKNGGATASRN